MNECLSPTEFLPHLFLDKEEDFEELCHLIILDPTWLMTAMKGVVELGSKSAEEVESESDVGRLSTSQVLKFERESIADLEVFSACWKLPVESLPKGSITVRQLCLIFQAYCLIFPVQCESVSASGQPESQFIVPCKLPFTIQDDYVYQLSKFYATFFFDFYDFLPDEIYHRLICLAWKNSKPLGRQEIVNRVSKRSCFFVNLEMTNWLIEHEYQRLKIMVE